MKKFLLPLALLSFASLAVFPQKKTTPDPNFKPAITANIPVIKISSKSGNNDFVAKPVASVVMEKRKTWGEIKHAPAPYYLETEKHFSRHLKIKALSYFLALQRHG